MLAVYMSMTESNTSRDGHAGRERRQRGTVVRELEMAILAGGYPAGSGLPGQRDLALQYGVTRTTMRRALDKLVRRGLLTCLPRVGYRINAPAPGALQGTAVRKIGFVWPSLPTDTADSSLPMLIEKLLADRGQVILFGDSAYDTERENDTLRRLCAAGMDALIIAPARHGSRSSELERWITSSRPVVLIGHAGRWRLPDDIAGRCNQVDLDNRQGMRLLIDDLAALGHRRFGFVAAEPLAGMERYGAFLDEMAGRALDTRQAWQVELIEKGAASACTLIEQMRRSGALPTALVCSHDGVANDVLRALRDMGIRCPSAISVSGFRGGRPVTSREPEPLTLVDDRFADQMREAMRLLARQWRGEGEAQHVRVQGVLVRGTSTGPAPGGGGHA